MEDRKQSLGRKHTHAQLSAAGASQPRAKKLDAFASAALKSVRRYRVKMWAAPSEDAAGVSEGPEPSRSSMPLQSTTAPRTVNSGKVAPGLLPAQPSATTLPLSTRPTSAGGSLLDGLDNVIAVTTDAPSAMDMSPKHAHEAEAGHTQALMPSSMKAMGVTGSVDRASGSMIHGEGQDGAPSHSHLVRSADGAVVIVEEEAPSCLINPHGRFMHRWDVVMIACLIFTAVLTPMEVSFFDTSDIDAMWVANRIVDILFFLDILTNFFIPIVNSETNETITDLRSIAWNYARKMFLFDVITVFPFDIIANYALDAYATSSSTSIIIVRLVRVARLIKLTRLLRVVRANRIFARWKSHVGISNGFISLTRFTVILILEAHWLACLWHLTAALEVTGPTWLDVVDNLGPSPWDRYVAALYFATMTITTIGYGDIAPVSSAERAVAIVAMITGGGLYAFIIGSMSSIIANLDRASGLIDAQRDDLNAYMREIMLPEPLRVQLREYFDQCGKLFRHAYYKHLLSAMSPALRGQVASHMHSEWISRIPFFNPPSKDEAMELVTAVAGLVEMEAFAPLEVVVREGHAADRLYIVHKGLAMTTAGRIIASGQYFGEAMILTNGRWMETVRSFTYLYAMTISKEALTRLLETGNFEGTRKLLRRSIIRLAFRREFMKAAVLSRIHQGFLGKLTGAATAVANMAITTKQSGGSFASQGSIGGGADAHARHSNANASAAVEAQRSNSMAGIDVAGVDGGASEHDYSHETAAASPDTVARRLWRRSVQAIQTATTMLGRKHGQDAQSAKRDRRGSLGGKRSSLTKIRATVYPSSAAPNGRTGHRALSSGAERALSYLTAASGLTSPAGSMVTSHSVLSPLMSPGSPGSFARPPQDLTSADGTAVVEVGSLPGNPAHPSPGHDASTASHRNPDARRAASQPRISAGAPSSSAGVLLAMNPRPHNGFSPAHGPDSSDPTETTEMPLALPAGQHLVLPLSNGALDGDDEGSVESVTPVAVSNSLAAWSVTNVDVGTPALSAAVASASKLAGAVPGEQALDAPIKPAVNGAQVRSGAAATEGRTTPQIAGTAATDVSTSASAEASRDSAQDVASGQRPLQKSSTRDLLDELVDEHQRTQPSPAPSPSPLPDIADEDAVKLVAITQRMPVLARVMSRRVLERHFDPDTAAILAGLPPSSSESPTPAPAAQPTTRSQLAPLSSRRQRDGVGVSARQFPASSRVHATSRASPSTSPRVHEQATAMKRVLSRSLSKRFGLPSITEPEQSTVRGFRPVPIPELKALHESTLGTLSARETTERNIGEQPAPAASTTAELLSGGPAMMPKRTPPILTIRTAPSTRALVPPPTAALVPAEAVATDDALAPVDTAPPKDVIGLQDARSRTDAALTSRGSPQVLTLLRQQEAALARLQTVNMQLQASLNRLTWIAGIVILILIVTQVVFMGMLARVVDRVNNLN